MKWFGDRVYGFIRFLIKVFMCCVYPTTIEGRENIPKSGSFIMIGNHTSLIDPIFLAGTMFPIKMSFMGKEELWRTKPLGWFFTQIGGFPVSRGNNDIVAMRKCLDVLNKGIPLGIFPEGTRSKNYELQEFKTGVAFMASKAKCPIVPTYIDTNKKGFKIFHRVVLWIGEPKTVEQLGYFGKTNGKTLDKITKDIENQVKMLIK